MLQSSSKKSSPRRAAAARNGAASRASASAAAWEQAQRVLVGGVNSPVRAFRRVRSAPVMLAGGRGAEVVDVDGGRYVDLIMGWGALILGHAHRSVVQAIRHQASRGALLGLTTELEVELAREIAHALPSIEQVRFTASGTEASMTAIRLARAHTGRSKVLSFEGCYHGHSDGLLVKRGSGLATLGLASSAGVPEPIARETIVIPYNDAAALEEAMARYGEQIACAIVEPIAANMGTVVPDRAFLRRLRELTSRHGALLIFDEVVTGFRVAWGGSQTLVEIRPDLTLLGKIIGGGLPIGALGGPRRLMRRLAPEGDVYHAGTFAGHPLSMAAGLAALRALRQLDPYRRLEQLGARLAAGLRDAATRAGVPVQVTQCASMTTVFFSEQPVTDFQTAQASRTTQFAAFANALRERHILVPPSPFETWFLSCAHTRATVDRIVNIAADAYTRV